MCICKTCGYKSECAYYEDYIQPVQKIVSDYETSAQFDGPMRKDPYLHRLSRVLDKYTECEFYEEKK